MGTLDVEFFIPGVPHHSSAQESFSTLLDNRDSWGRACPFKVYRLFLLSIQVLGPSLSLLVHFSSNFIRHNIYDFVKRKKKKNTLR